MTLRDLPSIERLLQSDGGAELQNDFGRSLTVEALRLEVDRARAVLRRGAAAPAPEGLIEGARRWLNLRLASTLQPVINATGVILHTNLGRAVLSADAQQAVLAAASAYSSLEYDLGRGERGRREDHLEPLLCQVTGAPAALVVNNNAAALLLALTGLARRKEVVVSRSQLIEIGGGFRIPDVLAQSGAKLVEVGTTNRTHRRDFEAALGPKTGLLLRAHSSNFRQVGFTAAPTLVEMVELGRNAGVPVIDDLGSGALLETQAFGLAHEPMVQESIQAGASMVAFSGDKLLGGPQAGILAGDVELIGKLKTHPLARAVRADKLCLAGLHATLLHYARGEAVDRVPVWRMIAMSEVEIRARAEGWAAELRTGEVRLARSTVGGGSLPEETLPTWALAIAADHPNDLAAALRRANPAVVARVDADQVLLDPRTVLPEQDTALIEAVRQVLPDARRPDGASK
ncbi:MAG TPA: L-seryl-tRNA(Sec) selenium transferase [Anaerolineales bacterium]|nr:L-seryl-tRNA(Sec) selenium transferase [Anaerolineales bacterium]